MPIQVLPIATSHLLGSAQVLTTPESLVKELVDNALDAKATSIDVLISANTLDRIEVHDNGHGIAPSDLDALGRRGYTSKLRNFNEVRTIGGSTLGFRGEALASATELGEVCVTTRTEGESVAAKVKLRSHGGVTSQTPTSHPIGTTVCILNFFSKLPVRKENALKEAKKALLRIKELLQSYALARLNIRFSLRVMKAKISNWSFAPRTNDGVREIVSQAIGRDIAVHCSEKFGTLSLPLQSGMTATESGSDTRIVQGYDYQTNERPKNEFILHAFIPKRDADFSKTVGGQYLSIDSRPISCMRGTPRKIIGVYKSAIRAIAADNVSEKLKTPFIRLNITCPPGSYDVNVEPAKDNVLFEDETVLVSLVEHWFKSIYTSPQTSSRGVVQQSQNQEDGATIIDFPEKVQSNVVATVDISPSTLDTREECDSVMQMDSESNLECDQQCQEPSLDKHSSSKQPDLRIFANLMDNRKSQIDMSEDLSEVASVCNFAEGSVHEAFESQIEPTEANKTWNPWLVAKLKVPVIKKHAFRPTLSSSIPPPCKQRLAGKNHLPNQHELLTHPEPYQTLAQGTSGKPRTGSSNPQSSLEIWLKQSQVDHLKTFDTSQLNSQNLSWNSSKDTATHSSFISARQKLYETPRSLSATQYKLASNQSEGIHKPFVSPAVKPQSTKTQIPCSEECAIIDVNSSRTSRLNDAPLDTIHDMATQESQYRTQQQAMVDDALDFERRKEATTREFRKERHRYRSTAEGLHSKVSIRKSSSPLYDLGSAITANLDPSQKLPAVDTFPERAPFKTCLPDDDPRAYLMRIQRSLAVCSGWSETTPKLKRAKTLLMPLEKVPKSAETHDLVQTLFTDISLLKKAMLGLEHHDVFSSSGCQAVDLELSSADLMKIKGNLETIVRTWLHLTAEEQIDLEINLSGLEENGRCKL